MQTTYKSQNNHVSDYGHGDDHVNAHVHGNGYDFVGHDADGFVLD